MVTRMRIRKAGGVYHVYNRGVLKEPVFYDQADREHVILLLGECAERYGVEFRSYCLMTNHIHLHMRTPTANIAEAMHWLFTRFSCRFNAKYDRKGHVFETRYKSVLVEPGRTEVELSRYIHRNPVKAGMVKCAADYAWSSMRRYLVPAERPDWLDVDAVLDSIPSPGTDVLDTYRRFVASPRKRDAFADAMFTNGTAVGSLGFIERTAKEHGLLLANALSTEEVLEAVQQVVGLPGFGAGQSRDPGNVALCASVYLLKTYATLSWKEAGRALGGRSGRTIQRTMERAKELMVTDRCFSEIVHSCLAVIGSAGRLWTI